MEPVGSILKQNGVGIPTRSSSNSSSTDSQGSAPSAQDSTTPCPVCGGAGYLRQDVPVGHPDFGNIVPCSCQQAKLESQRLADLRAVSNLDGMARYTFEAFKSDGVGLPEAKRTNVHTVYETARRYAADPRGWLVLLGGYGCGKTHLAVAIANEQLARGRSALFVVVPDLLDYLRATYSPHSAVTYDQRFDNVRNAPLLILDDLGTQSSTEWAKEKLYQVFNYRYNARLPTVVTSNQELEAIDARIRSRLIDPDLVQICTLLAPDFRATGADSMDHELSSLTMHVDQVFESFDLRERELSREEVESLQQALTFARNYAADPEDWLVLTGGYGCGKTHLAAAIANERVNQRASVLFVVVPDLLDHLRATYAPDSQISYDRRLDQVRTTPLLVLDDLGTHSATPWAQEKLYQIFNYRYNARLPTVITVADGVSVDERLKSRLFDRRRCINLKIDAPSYRGSETEAKRRSAKR